ncbi:tryptophan dimethylallyltransferase family protein [Amycolatopsis sp. NPDC051371]|uniref:tryptophan dimethylallyltransferase family protein n=1 Tax=Amycolatopsis sp. NPDC051371 TaxID=3155800 RepID=UPI003443EC7D
MLRALLPPWSHELIEAAPAHPSYVADDGFPAEMSVNWSGRHPELRVLFDSLGHDTGSPAESDFSRLQRVHEIFTPRGGRPSPAPLWHSIAWRPPSRVVHKTYFGLYLWPHAQREAAVAEAMARLGMADAWDTTRRQVENVDGTREIEFFAVDLADEAEARVKIYYRNHGAGLAEVNRVASVALRHDADDARVAYRTLAGDREDAGKAALSCLAFRPGPDRAAESTTYLRLPDLAASDEEAVERTAALLHREGVDPGRFRLLTAALAPGPLATTSILELVSYRTAGRRGDVTTYFRFPVYDRSLTPVDLA